MSLIQRLEQLTGPHREVDAYIWQRVYAPDGTWVAQSKFNGNWCVYEKCTRNGEKVAERNGTTFKQKPYTASIDAALTLVPKNYEWLLEMSTEPNDCVAKIGDPLLFMEGRSPLPAIALCIAALKARNIT